MKNFFYELNLKAIFKLFFWYTFGGLIFWYEWRMEYRLDWQSDEPDPDCQCMWCGFSFEEHWDTIGSYNTILAEQYTGGSYEFPGEVYHLEITCPRCYHRNFVIEDTSP